MRFNHSFHKSWLNLREIQCTCPGSGPLSDSSCVTDWRLASSWRHIKWLLGWRVGLIVGHPSISKVSVSEISLGHRLLKGKMVPYLREQSLSHETCLWVLIARITVSGHSRSWICPLYVLSSLRGPEPCLPHYDPTFRCLVPSSALGVEQDNPALPSGLLPRSNSIAKGNQHHRCYHRSAQGRWRKPRCDLNINFSSI